MNRAIRVLFLLAATWLAIGVSPAFANDLRVDAKALASTQAGEAERAVESIASRRDVAGLQVLAALLAGELRIDPAGNAYSEKRGVGLEVLTPGSPEKPAGALATPEIDNHMRRVLEPKIASLRLSSSDRSVRMTAADDLAKLRNDELAPIIRGALAREKDAEVREKLELAVAQVDLASDDTRRRLAALATIERAADASYKSDLERILSKNERGEFIEKNAEIRRAANSALTVIDSRLMVFGLIGHLFYGLSLGSVLLLASLGLAITFGLMRVINMAHGELLMIGAYSTFVVQQFFVNNLPNYSDLYIVVAVPFAFLMSALVGLAIERSVLRFLYGRPLETLLATWGISLILIQTVRVLFGAQNVAVANPQWLAGGMELFPGFVLTYSRLAVILFSAVVLLFVWFMLQRTPLGLQVRAVTQNRDMASGMGISARRVDAWTFAIGSGVAGLGGVALSQLGNVGPELGQGYIVDSFMVVVLGGVGKLAGTIAGAFGLGIVNKLLEPMAGAVLGKIAILAFIILFIQRRPQGIFALKGRAAEVT